MIHLGWQRLQTAQAAAKWPTAEGTILRSEVNNDGSFKAPYSVGMTYRYTVNARQYEGHRLTNSDYTTSSYGEIAQQLAKYPVGATVTVYYSPDSPNDALLQPGEASGANILFGVGGVFAFIGGGLLLSSLRKQPGTSGAPTSA